jgi:Putative collagen-binding domain of a collagenase
LFGLAFVGPTAPYTTIAIDGLGEFRGLDYLAAARTQDGSTVIAYLPTTRTFTVDLSKVAGSEAQTWWYNPRTGTSQTAGKFATNAKHQFTPPGEGDWVLVLDDASKNLPPPGKS